MADVTHMSIEDFEAIDGFFEGVVTPGPKGIRLLALGATPGEAYDAGGRM